ncbi:MAG: hypothetical protein BWX48_02652 [Verrucomicrobia bacterium ADurb.Bin006]|nr:MAG: hypothetical protein BWX48_02652 [Verrucomicrobia bacterium ADurb.Bin006]
MVSQVPRCGVALGLRTERHGGGEVVAQDQGRIGRERLQRRGQFAVDARRGSAVVAVRTVRRQIVGPLAHGLEHAAGAAQAHAANTGRHGPRIRHPGQQAVGEIEPRAGVVVVQPTGGVDGQMLAATGRTRPGEVRQHVGQQHVAQGELGVGHCESTLAVDQLTMTEHVPRLSADRDGRLRVRDPEVLQDGRSRIGRPVDLQRHPRVVAAEVVRVLDRVTHARIIPGRQDHGTIGGSLPGDRAFDLELGPVGEFDHSAALERRQAFERESRRHAHVVGRIPLEHVVALPRTQLQGVVQDQPARGPLRGSQPRGPGSQAGQLNTSAPAVGAGGAAPRPSAVIGPRGCAPERVAVSATLRPSAL